MVVFAAGIGLWLAARVAGSPSLHMVAVGLVVLPFAAALFVAGIPPRSKQRVTYTLAPEVRGRYSLGPLSVDVSDPFALTKLRIGFDQRDDLVVTPEIERLEAGPASPFGGANGLSLARHLFRTGDDFYTMRQYQEGDDLRRIHWPSVARSNQQIGRAHV